MLSLIKTSLFISLFFSFGINSKSLAGSLEWQCLNSAHSPLTFKIKFENNKAFLLFGYESSGSSLEEDLKTKFVTLTYDTSASHNNWYEYTGDILVDRFTNSYRTIFLRFHKNELIKQKGINSNLLPSNQHSKNQRPTQLLSYGMLCNRK